MKNTLIIALTGALALTSITGCQTIEPTPLPNHTTAVLVGLGYKCDKKELRKKGSDLDISTINETLRFAYSTSLEYLNENRLRIYQLQDEYATCARVKSALRAAVQSELAIIYFSCKTTQVATDDPSEKDGLDEALRLYDGLLLDNEIWEILQTAKGRVFIMFETDHGTSMFQASESKDNLLFDLADEINNADPAVKNQLNLVCWSESMEGEVVPESSFGSKMTNVFYFKMSNVYLSYQTVYDKIYKSLSKKRNLSKIVVGEDFSHLSMFR